MCIGPQEYSPQLDEVGYTLDSWDIEAADIQYFTVPALDAARDVFLMGCYTAQRYSDYSTINETNIRKLMSGEVVVDLKQQKTGSRVIVPARREVLEILAKYDNILPKTYEQKVNKYIKEVAEMAGITDEIEVEQMEEGRIVKSIVFKNELVKTHTASHCQKLYHLHTNQLQR